MNKSYQDLAERGNYGYIVGTLLVPTATGTMIAAVVGYILIKLF